MPSTNTRHAQRGMTLVDALVAFVVAGLGLAAMAVAQTALHAHGDITRQRTEAVQLAQAELEHLRNFSSMADFAALTTLPTTASSSLDAHTVYTLKRRLAADGPLLFAGVDVQWTDRAGHPSAVALDSLVAGIDPSLSGRLAAPAAQGGNAPTMSRAGAVPLAATELGDGRSAWLPPGLAAVAWVFDDASGEVTDICRVSPDVTQATVSVAALADCTAAAALTVEGHVLFATGATLDAAVAEHPDSPALDLDMQLLLTEGTRPAPACGDDSATRPAQADVAFVCLAQPDPRSGRWSGRLDVLPSGWRLGTDALAYRVCRYSFDADGKPGLDNSAHPLDYAGVATALAHQNFLVIRGDHACPSDHPADPAHGDWVDSNTVEQAPTPLPTPAG